jgi:lamin tail-like protein
MRNTLLFAVFAVSGCFNPRLTDGGFACDPSDPRPCPDGYFCRAKADIFVCTQSLAMPTPPADMAMSDGTNDMAMSGSTDMAQKPGDMAMSGPVDMAMTGSCTLANVTINEVQTSSILSASDEFIELYNNCNGTVSLSGSLVYRAKTSMVDNTVFVASLSGKTIAANSWFLAAGNAYSGGATPDVTFTSGMADANGGVALRDGGGIIVDSMGWGTGTSNGFQQGTPATNLNITMSRIPDGKNTHVNNVDFTDSNTSTPRAMNKP